MDIDTFYEVDQTNGHRACLEIHRQRYSISREKANFDWSGLVAELVVPGASVAEVACKVMLPLPLKRTRMSVMQASEAQLYRAVP